MKQNLKFFVGLPLLISLMVSGCGKEEGEEGSSTLSSEEIEGEWIGDCRAVGSNYSKTTYEFVGKAFTYTSASYSDAACAEERDIIFGRGTYALSGDTQDADGLGLAKMDFTYVTFTRTFTADPSAAVDWAAACGGASQSNGTVNVLGMTCTVEDFSQTFAAEQFASMVKIDSKLHVPDVSSYGVTEETRSVFVNQETGGLIKTEVAAAE
jgi:hypothetical protein